MKKAFLVLVFLAVCGNAYSAEFLVQAQNHWADSLTQIEVNKLSTEDKALYDCRTQVGDVIDVKPDGWIWGKEEALPKFIVVKVQGMSVFEGEKYIGSLIDSGGNLVRSKKTSFSGSIVENAILIKASTINLDKSSFIQKSQEKTGNQNEVLPAKADILSYLKYFSKPFFEFFDKKAFASTQLLKTVKPSGQGGDYTSVATALSGNQQDLVSNDKYLDIEIGGDWSGVADTATWTIDYYTTNATHYINIYTASSARHSGVWDANKYTLTPTTNNKAIIAHRGNYYVTGVQMSFPTPSSDLTFIIPCDQYCGVGDFVKTDSIIIKQTGGDASVYISVFSGNINKDMTVTHSNILVYDVISSATIYTAIFEHYSAVTLNILNATVVNSTKTALNEGGSGVMTMKNVGSSNVANADGGTITKVTCSVATPSFIDPDNDDYRLASSDTAWKDSGTDLSSVFTNDIQGETRSGTWDIGADEYVSASRRRMMIIQ